MKLSDLLYLVLQLAGLLLATIIGYGLLFIALIAAGCPYWDNLARIGGASTHKGLTLPPLLRAPSVCMLSVKCIFGCWFSVDLMAPTTSELLVPTGSGIMAPTASAVDGRGQSTGFPPIPPLAKEHRFARSSGLLPGPGLCPWTPPGLRPRAPLWWQHPGWQGTRGG